MAQRTYNYDALCQKVLQIVRENKFVSVPDICSQTGLNTTTARRLLYKVAVQTDALKQVQSGLGRLPELWTENQQDVIRGKVLEVEGNKIKLVTLKMEPIGEFEIANPANYPVGRIIEVNLKY